jgi:hypothetical protein
VYCIWNKINYDYRVQVLLSHFDIVPVKCDHHHRRRALPHTKKESSDFPILKDRATSSHLPSVLAQKPVFSVVNKELITRHAPNPNSSLEFEHYPINSDSVEY